MMLIIQSAKMTKNVKTKLIKRWLNHWMLFHIPNDNGDIGWQEMQ